MQKDTDLIYHNLNEEEKKIICSWQYEGDYKIYNLPSYKEMKAKQFGFCNPASSKNYYAFYNQNLLVGFVNIVNEDKEIFIGIGVNPLCCNRGYGQQILKKAYEIAQIIYPNKPLYLEVRSWNQRAINCYLKAGFKIDGDEFVQKTSIGTGSFYRMIKK